MDTEPVASAVAAVGIGRRGVLTAGVGAALALATLTEDVEAAAAAKSGWRYCDKCRGLFAGKGTDSVGVCPAGGSHKPLKGYNYLLLSGLSVEDLNLWRFFFQCEKCRGLFVNDQGDTGVCPKGGAHKQTGPNYALWAGTALPFMEADWRECSKCSGVYWSKGANGVCPAGGAHQPRTEDFKLILLR